MNKIVIGIFGIVLFATILLISGCTTGTTEKAMVKDTIVENTAMEKTGDTAMIKNTTEEGIMMQKIDDTSMEKKDNTMMEQKETMTTYSGNVLAGKTTPYIEFNKQDYDAALASNKTIILNFYASWCPSCKAEQPDAFVAFNQLNMTNVVGFRVNYKDSDTDADETAMAKQFGIAYQHTKVVIKNGAQVLKSPETWDTQRYIDEANKYK